MLRLGINELRPGLRVRAGLVHPTAPERLLLKPGAVLTTPIIASLARHGVRQVWVEHTQTDDLAGVANPELWRARMAVYRTLKNDLTRPADHAITAERLSACRHAVVELVRRAEAARPHAGLAEPLYDAEATLASHGANTAYLAILLGLELDTYVLRERRGLSARQGGNLTNLGLGAMLHDVGKLQLDAAGARRHEATEPVRAGEAGPYTEHPDLGYEMLTGADAPVTVRHIVRCHHHREDGTGWPDQRATPRAALDDPAGPRPHVFTRIVSAANVLDTLMYDADGVPRPVVAAMSDFADPRFEGWFDPVVRRAVLRRLPPFPIGSHVELSDGRFAVVIAANSRQPCRPVVRVLDRDAAELHLGEQAELCIKSCAGEPVGRWLFELSPAGVVEPPSEAA